MQINWSREELILACDLVRQNDWWELRPSDPRVAELSRRLQVPFVHPTEGRPANFRNINGVSRKTADLMTQLPHYQGKATKGGRLDRVVLEEFLEDPVAMAAAAGELTLRIDNGDWGLLPDPTIPSVGRTRPTAAPLSRVADRPTLAERRTQPALQPRAIDPSGPEAALASALVESPTFREQHVKSGRHALRIGLVHAVVAQLAAGDGRASSRELAAAAGLEGRSFDPTCAAMRRLLNLEGYTVLALDADGTTVRLDLPLLRDQFRVDAA
ncbi:hypothetical protein HP550_14515 [Cellulomonas humilata]|uniref:Alkaline phosphatase-like protein PglZ C-terminal domain-containing protein n=1 Tax=Cellulomonas humilata TaxID=144055 RepID=A0A7Y6A4D9_9CELL|nr:hypothetical protein [Cellulomonas humilata]NUU18467.1 hypothetical protein [Cellulomonas humilata]